MKPQSILRRSLRDQRGVALVLFVLLVFVFMAIATIAIDVGRAYVTQQQMQVAVDTAALEGARLRDYEEYQDLSNQYRRPRVSQLVRLVFDDDLHPTGGVATVPGVTGMTPDDADEFSFGAGPRFSIEGGTGPWNAQGVIVTPQVPVWDDPILQTNWTGTPNDNVASGDQVSGTYYSDLSHDEPSGYDRLDFRPGIGVNRWKALGYLVRMRRTGLTGPPDDQPGRAMTGERIPFLFGLGSLMLPASPSGPNLRTLGLTVRATAIASAQPALRASPRPVNPDGTPISDESAFGVNKMLGLHPIVIRYDYWTTALAPGTWPPVTRALDVTPTGDLRDPVTGNIVGRFAQLGTCIGQDLASTPESMMPGPPRQAGYIAIEAPITEPGGGTRNRVVGYGFADARSTSAGHITVKAGITSILASQTADVRVWVAANGVAARLDSSAPQLTEAQWSEVFQRNRAIAYGGSNNPGGQPTNDPDAIRPGTLLAPVLVR